MKRSLIALSLLLVATPAAAQRVNSPYRFLEHAQHGGVFVGHLTTSEGVLEAGPRSALTFGAHWGLAVAGPIKLTVELGYTPTKRTVRDTTFVEAASQFNARGDADVKLLTIMGNLRFDITGQRTWNSLQPFLFTGAGAVIDVAGSSALDEDLPANARFDFGTSFAGQAGAGVEWFPTSRVSVRGDGRGLLWKLNVPEAFQLTAQGRDLAGSDWERNVLVALGVSIHF